MIDFPNCKINIGLQVTSKRPDGFHNIQTVLYPVQWRDALEVIKSDQFTFTTAGIPIPGNTEENLCVKAWKLLHKNYDIPPVNSCLLKNIPVGAGLGGGSADGVLMLRLLNKYYSIGLTDEKLEQYASELGSDCPFFIHNRPVLASGKGDEIQPLELNISAYEILLIYPGIVVNTAWAYQHIQPKTPGHLLPDAISAPVEEWKDVIDNDFETAVFTRWPEIKKLKDLLYQHGAIYASMTGSGSAVYGIYEKLPFTTKDIEVTFEVPEQNYFSGKLTLP